MTTLLALALSTLQADSALSHSSLTLALPWAVELSSLGQSVDPTRGRPPVSQPGALRDWYLTRNLSSDSRRRAAAQAAAEAELSRLKANASASNEQIALAELWVQVVRIQNSETDRAMAMEAAAKIEQLYRSQGKTELALVARYYSLNRTGAAISDDVRIALEEIAQALPRDRFGFLLGAVEFQLGYDARLRNKPLIADKRIRAAAQLLVENASDDPWETKLAIDVASTLALDLSPIEPATSVRLLKPVLGKLKDPTLEIEGREELLNAARENYLFAHAFLQKPLPSDEQWVLSEQIAANQARFFLAQSGDPEAVDRAASTCIAVSQYLVAVGETERALEAIAPCLKLAERFPNLMTQTKWLPDVVGQISTLRFYLGDVHGALSVIEQVLGQMSSRPPGSTHLLLMANIQIALGRLVDARNTLDLHKADRTSVPGGYGDLRAEMYANTVYNLFDTTLRAMEGDAAALERMTRPRPAALTGALGSMVFEGQSSLAVPALLKQRKYEAALPLAKERYEAAQRMLPGSRERVVAALHYAVALEGIGDLNMASEVLKATRDATPSDVGLSARLGANLVTSLAGQGKPSEAAVLIPEVKSEFANELRTLAQSGDERSLIDAAEISRRFLQAVTSLSQAKALDSSEAYDVVFGLRGLASTAYSKTVEAGRILGRDPDVRGFVEKSIQLKREYSNEALRSEQSASTRLSELEREIRSNESSLALALTQKGIEVPAPGSWQSGASALAPDEALVEFIAYQRFEPQAGVGADPWKEERLGAFVVRPGRDVSWVDLGPVAPIRSQAQAFISQIVAEQGTDEDRAAREATGRQLYSQLFVKLGSLPPNIYVVPDGPIFGLPMDALTLPDGRFLIEEHSISLLASGRELVATRSDVKSGPSVVIADPFLSEDWGPLVGAAEEGRFVSQRLGVPLLSDDAASEAALLAVHRPAVLHIATHGKWSPTASSNPMTDSLLVFSEESKANRNPVGADGFATALEISQLDLVGTELVFVAACESAIGEVSWGEGVFGLQRAFRIAGAATVIGGLYEIPSSSTQRIVTRFYQNWKPGAKPGSKRAALRLAQLECLKEPVRSAPKHWAGLILIGER